MFIPGVVIVNFFSKLIITIFVLFLCYPFPSYGFERYNRVTKYDGYFKKYTKHFFGPEFDWRYFKSQAIAESNLNSDAKSHVGAKGIMQIMPKTFEEIKYKNASIKGSSLQPKWNIDPANRTVIINDTDCFVMTHAFRPVVAIR